jgi:hypothetical protein
MKRHTIEQLLESEELNTNEFVLEVPTYLAHAFGLCKEAVPLKRQRIRCTRLARLR